MMGFYQDYFGISWMWMGLGMILFWVAVIWFLIWIINHSKETSGHDKSPLIILKERYAKGEITKNEYESKRKGLER